MEKISFVIPCYKSEHTIEIVVREIDEQVKKTNYCYEIVLVNDCSPDNVWKKICALAEEFPIIGLSLAKNFGQANAIMAGYAVVSGDIIVTMDDDGQSPVEDLQKMISKLERGHYDVVYGTSENAKHNIFRRIGSAINSIMSNIMFEKPMNERIVSFYIMKSFVVQEIIKYIYPYTYISGLVFRTANSIGYCPVNHRSRMSGKSGYSLKKLFSVWLNGFTAFSIKPLRIASYFGLFCAALGFIFGIITIIQRLVRTDIQTGWSSMMCIMLLLGGLILLVLGMIGEYLGRIYICINKSPQYVIREKIGVSNSTERK